MRAYRMYAHCGSPGWAEQWKRGEDSPFPEEGTVRATGVQRRAPTTTVVRAERAAYAPSSSASRSSMDSRRMRSSSASARGMLRERPKSAPESKNGMCVKRPLGTYGRGRIYDEQSGRDYSVTDGYWIVASVAR